MAEWERQLRYCIRSQENPTKHRCNFLVINESREINAIKQKLFLALQSTEEIAILTKGRVSKELGYELIAFISNQEQPITPEQLRRVYNGTIRKDDRLADRVKTDGLSNYVDNLMSNPPK